MAVKRPFDARVPFTPRQGRDQGLSRAQLLGPEYQKLWYGLYVSSAVRVTDDLKVSALLGLMADDAHLSHYSAAKRWKLWVPSVPGIHICRAQAHRHSRPDVVSHHCPHHGERRTSADVAAHQGLAVTTPIGCYFELATELSLVDLAVLGDSLVRRNNATPEKLRERAAKYSGPGARKARDAAALVRSGVDSPMESRLRLLLVLAGLPEPTVDLRLYDKHGNLRRRLDLAYEVFHLAVEYDGEQHRETSEAWDADVLRRDELASERWRPVIVTKFGIYRDPTTTVDRVERALRDAGWTGTRRSRRDWPQHFPGY